MRERFLLTRLIVDELELYALLLADGTPAQAHHTSSTGSGSKVWRLHCGCRHWLLPGGGAHAWPRGVRLRKAAWEEGAWLYFIEDEDAKHTIAELIAEGDRIQLSDKRFRRELASWVHPNRTKSRDGMPGYAFGFGDLMSMAGPFVMRTFDTGKGQAAKDRQLAEGSPVLAILGTEDDTPPDWLAAGQALARVLLRARAEGVWASFLNQPIEVAELRPRLRGAIGVDGYPQLLFRMGYGPEVRPTPRRPIEEFS